MPDAPPPAPPGGPFAPVVYETDFAGLFFLARTFLQLEVGEHLWCAGLDERWVLRALADHLLGGVHDPAAAVFAGLDPRTAPEPRPVPAWAVVEVKEKLRNALWQFSKGALAEEIERFDVRVGPLSAWALPNPSEDLVACLAAATVLAVSHRLEVEPTHGALQRLITEAGRVVVRPEQVHVWLAMRAVRTDVRRAGLDINPGWVPWMKAKLEIVFGTDRDSSLGAV